MQHPETSAACRCQWIQDELTEYKNRQVSKKIQKQGTGKPEPVLMPKVSFILASDSGEQKQKAAYDRRERCRYVDLPGDSFCLAGIDSKAETVNQHRYHNSGNPNPRASLFMKNKKYHSYDEEFYEGIGVHHGNITFTLGSQKVKGRIRHKGKRGEPDKSRNKIIIQMPP